ncbi:MAG: hypothetical protein H7X80_11610 [bacterium]|nr:hypothetical protein [Candidatus Kapabacteria bacterium]
MKIAAIFVLFYLAVMHASAQSPADVLRVAVYLDDSTAATGTISAASNQVIVVRTANTVRSIPFDSVRAVEVIEPLTMDAQTIAVLGGIYLGATSAIVLQQENESSLIQQREHTWPGPPGGLFGGMIVGGIVSAFLSQSEQDIRTMYYPSDAIARIELIEHIARGAKDIPQWKLTAHAAAVFGSTNRVQGQALRDAGYAYPFTGESRDLTWRSTNIAMVRRVELSHSITDAFDASISTTSLRQPGLEGVYYVIDTTLPPPSISFGYHVIETYSGDAWTLGALYRLPLSRRFDVRSGARIGVSKVSMRRVKGDGGADHQSPEVDKTSLAGGISLEVLARLNGLLIGVSGDYIVVPPVDIPANEKLRLPASSMNLSSASIGFVIGMEF